MRSFPFPDRYRIGPGIFGMRSVSPVPSCSCSVACLVRSFCGSGGDEVASGMRRFESAWDVFGIPIVYFPLQTFEFPMFRFPGIKLSTAVRFGAEA